MQLMLSVFTVNIDGFKVAVTADTSSKTLMLFAQWYHYKDEMRLKRTLRHIKDTSKTPMRLAKTF